MRFLAAVLALVAIGVAFILLLPMVETSDWFASLNPVEAYLVFNVGYYLLFAGVAGAVVTRALRKPLNLYNLLVGGLGAFLLFSFVLDMYEPPFAISPDGTFAISTSGGTLAQTSVDYMTGWVWTQVGFSGPSVYYLTYLVTPIIAVLVAVFLLGA